MVRSKSLRKPERRSHGPGSLTRHETQSAELKNRKLVHGVLAEALDAGDIETVGDVAIAYLRNQSHQDASAGRLSKTFGISPTRGMEAVIKARLIGAVLKALGQQGITHVELAKRSGLPRSTEGHPARAQAFLHGDVRPGRSVSRGHPEAAQPIESDRDRPLHASNGRAASLVGKQSRSAHARASTHSGADTSLPTRQPDREPLQPPQKQKARTPRGFRPFQKWCGRLDLNQHALRHTPLNSQRRIRHRQ